MGKNVGCKYCADQALAPGFTDPPLCEGHVMIVQAVSYLRDRLGWPASDITPADVGGCLVLKLGFDLDLDNVDRLCASMPEFAV